MHSDSHAYHSVGLLVWKAVSIFIKWTMKLVLPARANCAVVGVGSRRLPACWRGLEPVSIELCSYSLNISCWFLYRFSVAPLPFSSLTDQIPVKGSVCCYTHNLYECWCQNQRLTFLAASLGLLSCRCAGTRYNSVAILTCSLSCKQVWSCRPGVCVDS
jgi:hypothetical protein